MTIHEFLSRAWEMMLGRATGPMTFRLIVQPAIAALFAILSGLKDVREGRSFSRSELVKHLKKDVGKVFIGASLLDVIYQIIVFRWIYPGQVVIVATCLTIVPYLLIRGPATRIISLFYNRNK